MELAAEEAAVDGGWRLAVNDVFWHGGGGWEEYGNAQKTLY